MAFVTRPPSMTGPSPAGIGRTGGMAIVQNAEVVARLYRRLVLVVGLQILLTIGRIPLLVAVPSEVVPLSLAIALVVLVSAAVLTVTAYQLAEQMGLDSPFAWAAAMFLPCINILSLLVLSAKATAWCKQYEIKVGLFGPTKESIEELRRRVMTAPFD
jgi:hypothetical protein